MISKNQLPITTSSRPYHSLDWLNKVPETNKVTRNRQFVIVGLPPLMMQKSRIHLAVIWCLSLTFFCDQKVLLSSVHINTLDFAFQFNDKHLPMWTIKLYYRNNNIKISASNNDKFLALSISWMIEYSTRN